MSKEMASRDEHCLIHDRKTRKLSRNSRRVGGRRNWQAVPLAPISNWPSAPLVPGLALAANGLHLGQNLFRFREQDPPHLRERELARTSIKQAATQIGLQRLQTMADTGGRQMQFLSGAAHVQGVRQGYEYK